MSRPSPTRMALLAVRARTQGARRAMEVLRAKRDALSRELRAASPEAAAFRDRAAELAARAGESLALAVGAEGRDALASMALPREVVLDLRVDSIWGVRVPRLSVGPLVRRATDRGYGLTGTSVHVDDAAARHEELVSFVLEQAPRVIRLHRLAAEIARTTRKVANLEHVVLPRLAREALLIERVLSEREREDRFRLGLAFSGEAAR